MKSDIQFILNMLVNRLEYISNKNEIDETDLLCFYENIYEYYNIVESFSIDTKTVFFYYLVNKYIKYFPTALYKIGINTYKLLIKYEEYLDNNIFSKDPNYNIKFIYKLQSILNFIVINLFKMHNSFLKLNSENSINNTNYISKLYNKKYPNILIIFNEKGETYELQEICKIDMEIQIINIENIFNNILIDLINIINNDIEKTLLLL
jgi:hypothetical protein